MFFPPCQAVKPAFNKRAVEALGLTTSACQALYPDPARIQCLMMYFKAVGASCITHTAADDMFSQSSLQCAEQTLSRAHQGVEAAVPRKVSIEMPRPVCAGEPQLLAACSLEVHLPCAVGTAEGGERLGRKRTAGHLCHRSHIWHLLWSCGAQRLAETACAALQISRSYLLVHQ